MESEVLISSFGYVDAQGFGGLEGAAAWDRSSPASSGELPWHQAVAEPFPRFKRLDLLSKYIATAVSLAGPDRIVSPQDLGTAAVGLTTDSGCLDCDHEYWKAFLLDEAGNPKLFPYTLPSIGIGEVAIRYGIHGPAYCWMAGRESDLVGFWECVRVIEEGEASACLFICARAMSKAAREAIGQDGVGPGDGNHACAMVLQSAGSHPPGGAPPLGVVRRQKAVDLDGEDQATSVWEMVRALTRSADSERKFAVRHRVASRPTVFSGCTCTAANLHERPRGTAGELTIDEAALGRGSVLI